jgi:DNA-binding transcriptional MerR regulator
MRRIETMKVGQLAEAAGVNVQAIRFYERRGLLPAPPRLTSGYRDYPAETAPLALLIKQMQGLGFTLHELERFIRLLESQPHNPAERRRRIESKLQSIDEQIKRLRSMRDELGSRLETCECCTAPYLKAAGAQAVTG